MSYWDIDEFLAEQQKINCHFTKEAPGLQFLDPTKGHNGNLEANEQIEVPIWILNVINDYMPEMDESAYFKVKFPGYLHSKEFEHRVNSFIIGTRNSSLQKVNFERESTYMYETYLLLNKIMSEQKTIFDKSLIGRLLRIRGKYILIRASSYVGDINVDMALNTYTDFETKIYRKTKRIMEECNAWKYSHQWLDKYNTLKKKTQK